MIVEFVIFIVAVLLGIWLHHTFHLGHSLMHFFGQEPVYTDENFGWNKILETNISYFTGIETQ